MLTQIQPIDFDSAACTGSWVGIQRTTKQDQEDLTQGVLWQWPWVPEDPVEDSRGLGSWVWLRLDTQGMESEVWEAKKKTMLLCSQTLLTSDGCVFVFIFLHTNQFTNLKSYNSVKIWQ